MSESKTQFFSTKNAVKKPKGDVVDAIHSASMKIKGANALADKVGATFKNPDGSSSSVETGVNEALGESVCNSLGLSSQKEQVKSVGGPGMSSTTSDDDGRA